MKCSLGVLNFLEEISSLSHSIVFLYFFALITEEGFLISPCYSLELCIQILISFLFSFAFCFSSFHKDQEAIKKKEYKFWKLIKNVSLKEKFMKRVKKTCSYFSQNISKSKDMENKIEIIRNNNHHRSFNIQTHKIPKNGSEKMKLLIFHLHLHLLIGYSRETFSFQIKRSNWVPAK